MSRVTRDGSVIPSAVAFTATALVLAWIAVHALYVGRHAGTPRRTLFAGLALAAAIIVIGVSATVVARAAMRSRRLAGLMRLGERVVGNFAAEVISPDADLSSAAGQPVTLTITNQRLLIHRPGPVDPPWLDLEHEEIVRVRALGPVLRGHLRRCLAIRLVLADGRRLSLRMDAAAALDFAPVSGQYLEPTRRRMRALVVAAEGPTPTWPDEPLSTILSGAQAAICLLELAEHYLRVMHEHAAPLADLRYCFHWEHMTVGELRPPDQHGCPEGWRQVRLVFHEDSALTLCGTEAAMTRLRAHALARGARPAGPADA